jgi:hypothetical protein
VGLVADGPLAGEPGPHRGCVLAFCSHGRCAAPAGGTPGHRLGLGEHACMDGAAPDPGRRRTALGGRARRVLPPHVRGTTPVGGKPHHAVAAPLRGVFPRPRMPTPAYTRMRYLAWDRECAVHFGARKRPIVRCIVPTGNGQSGKRHIPPNLVVGRCRRTLIASRSEDLQVEHPVRCRDATALHFHSTFACVQGPALVGDQVVEVR